MLTNAARIVPSLTKEQAKKFSLIRTFAIRHYGVKNSKKTPRKPSLPAPIPGPERIAEALGYAPADCRRIYCRAV